MKKKKFILVPMLLISLMFFTGCKSDIEEIKLIKSSALPSWLADPGDQPQYKVLVQVKFNKVMDPSSFNVTNNFKVSVKGMSSGNTDMNKPGKIHNSPDNKTFIYISDENIQFSIGAGEDLEYTIELVGNGNNCIKRSGGECMDGSDNDTNPGGNYSTKIKRIG